MIGVNVQQRYEFGQFSDGHQLNELVELRIDCLRKNPEYLAEVKVFKRKFEKIEFLLTEYLPIP